MYERSWPNGNTGESAYYVTPAWVAGYWTGGFPWRGGVRDPVLKKDVDVQASFYFFDDSWNRVYHSISNGVLWSYAGADLSAYVCGAHQAAAERAGCKNVLRSYVMNAYFGANLKTSFSKPSANVTKDREKAARVSELSKRGNAGTLLLFAELPACDALGNEQVNKGLAASDGILDVEIKGYSVGTPDSEEIIGFNHRLAKRMIAHVAFADGHVDAVIAPDEASLTDLRNLTYLLCNGLEVPAKKIDWKMAREEAK
jgi:prepilin-type processing-associated H-X9-DG protein